LGGCVMCVGCAADVSASDVDDSPVGVSEEALKHDHHSHHGHCGRDGHSSSAEPIVDQSFAPPPLDLGASINDAFRFAAQTFTAAVDGSLTAVSVEILGDSPLPFHIGLRAVDNGLPGSIDLAEGNPATANSTLADPIALSTPVRQHAGQQFAIVVDYPAPPPGSSPGHGTWAGATGDLYADGSSAFSADGSSWQAGTGADVFFETFVVPSKHAHCR
jgi:hypothetical protein